MQSDIRKWYNANFSKEKYDAFLNDMNRAFNYTIEFRISETPIFIGASFRDQLIAAGQSVVDVITEPGFMSKMDKAVPPEWNVPNQDAHPGLLAIDFAICEDGKGGYIPQLIELQGFASLYAYQEWLSQMFIKHFNIPADYNNKFFGLGHEEYINILQQTLLNGHHPENVILLEIEPWKQKTQIDFKCTKLYTGIETVCLSELIKEGRSLLYLKDGVKTPVHRIYNRIIFDELAKRDDLPRKFHFRDEVDVEWIAHPNWFFRISKFTMPFLKSMYVPETYFLHELKQIPLDLENWVLKPLFSFSGQGVLFDVTASDIERIEDRQNYILQKKVKYAEAIVSPTGPVKGEVRLLYTWQKNESKPRLLINLSRMSKGKMIGVQYNKDLDWVGGTTSFFLEMN